MISKDAVDEKLDKMKLPTLQIRFLFKDNQTNDPAKQAFAQMQFIPLQNLINKMDLLDLMQEQLDGTSALTDDDRANLTFDSIKLTIKDD